MSISQEGLHIYMNLRRSNPIFLRKKEFQFIREITNPPIPMDKWVVFLLHFLTKFFHFANDEWIEVFLCACRGVSSEKPCTWTGLHIIVRTFVQYSFSVSQI